MAQPLQAVILAGGKGTRLAPLTKDIPKPMVSINGIPFLTHLFDLLRENGIRDVLILLGYKHDKVVEYYGDGKAYGLKIQYSIGEVNWKTGLRLKFALKRLQERFLLLYCDNFWPLVLNQLLEFHEGHGKRATVTVFSNRDGTTKNNMFVDKEGIVLKYDKERLTNNLNAVEIGFFIMEKALIRGLPEGNYPFEKVLLAQLIKEKQLRAYLTHHKYYSIGSLERLPHTEKYLQKRKVIFLDRDGTINKKAAKADYVKSWSEFVFLKGSIEALKKLSDNEFEIYIITNQAGIARAKMTLESLTQIHSKLILELSGHGVQISGIYHCPHGWAEGCSCRKPEPGMFFQAAFENDINLTKSILIGDDERDIIAGERAGCKDCYLVDSNNSLLDIVNKIRS